MRLGLIAWEMVVSRWLRSVWREGCGRQVCDEVVVECSPLGYGRAGVEEGFVEKYSQSFGDAERAARMFHRVADGVESESTVGLGRYGKDSVSVSRAAH